MAAAQMPSQDMVAIIEEGLERLSVAGKTYDFRIERRCRVCRNASVMSAVNTMLANGMSYAQILDMLQPYNTNVPRALDRIGVESIRTHRTQHFPTHRKAVALYRDIVEHRAAEAQIDFVNGTISALTPLAYYDVLMHMAYKTLQGASEVTPELGLRAAEKLHAGLLAERGERDVEQMVVQFNTLVGAVKDVVGANHPELIPLILARLRGETPEETDDRTDPVPDGVVEGSVEEGSPQGNGHRDPGELNPIARDDERWRD